MLEAVTQLHSAAGEQGQSSENIRENVKRVSQATLRIARALDEQNAAVASALELLQAVTASAATTTFSPATARVGGREGWPRSKASEPLRVG